jgi:hypothetical protein
MSEFATSSSTPLSPEQVEQKRQHGRTNYYLRLPLSYVPFFQAMAEDYFQRGKIESPTIGLLAKTCLITAGNAWNRMQIQLMNKEYERKVQQQHQQQDYQQRPETQASDNLVPESIAIKRSPPFVVEKTKRQLQKEAWDQVNTLTTDLGYPTFAARFDTSNMDGNKQQQRRLQPRYEDQFYYDEDYGVSQ